MNRGAVMKLRVDFCTCLDKNCPNHPENSEMGCTLCVEKNLKSGEVPACFFKSVDPEYKGPGYFYSDFAKLVNDKK